MLANGSQMPIIVSDRSELRRCVMHLWPNYSGIGLNIKPSKPVNKQLLPHVIKDVDVDSPAMYAGVLNNDYIIKVGERLVEHEKFDTVLKLIKEQLKRDRKVDLLLLNQTYYAEFKRRNEIGDTPASSGSSKKHAIDAYNSPKILQQVKYYESPVFNPNGGGGSGSAAASRPQSINNTVRSTSNLATINSLPVSANVPLDPSSPPEPRLCHLLTWSYYDGYGFYIAYSQDSNACYVKSVEPNSPAQLGGLRPYDRIIELNGKKVTARDKDTIQREIYKYRNQSAFNTTKSAGSASSSRSRSISAAPSTSRQVYLNLFVADPSTYKQLTGRKVDLSTKNKNLKIRECFTPPENSLLARMETQNANNGIKNGTIKSTTSTIRFTDIPPDAAVIAAAATAGAVAGATPALEQNQKKVVTTTTTTTTTTSMAQRALQLDQAVLDSIILKYCTVRRLKNSPDKLLGFEMTKRGQTAHFISRVNPGSAAALAGLCVDDYLIELNDQNIEHDDNGVLKEKLFRCMEPSQGGGFKFTTMNKLGYDYCLENGIDPGYFVQLNKSKIKSFETPRELSEIYDPSSSVAYPTTDSSQPVIQHQRRDSLGRVSIGSILNQPRQIVLHKTPDVRELGFSIIRMKNNPDHIINDVIPGSLADRSGLRVNDCLVEVNGENVEQRSHLETVNKIHELTKTPSTDISLLVIQKNIPKATNIVQTPATNQTTTPQSVHRRSPSAASRSSLTRSSANIIAGTTDATGYPAGSTSNSVPPTTIPGGFVSTTANVIHVEKPLVPKHIETMSTTSISSKKVITNHLNQPYEQLPGVASTSPPSINVYPEIKVCEFQGYPHGTQLGLVITSDEYSHDIIKVAEGSPAQRAGLAEGDVIIAINDVNIEGAPNGIDLLNDFDDTRSLRVLVASRYALEWSKLLRIKITERDWPNIKKNITRYSNAANSTTTTPYTSRRPAQPPPPPTNPAYNLSTSTTVQHRTHSPPPLTSNPSNGYYQAPAVNGTYHQSRAPYTLNNSSTSAGSGGGLVGNNTVRSVKSYHSIMNAAVDSVSQHQSHQYFTLSRSAVDITTDGKVLRLCTLVLDPHSTSPLDSEFGFDLVTKIGAHQKIGDYFIDTIDDDSPASLSGLKPGDRLLEVDGMELSNRTFEEVVKMINEAKLRGRLRLLVYPSIVINYGNPNVNHQQNSATNSSHNTSNLSNNNANYSSYGSNLNYQDTRSMPDLNMAPETSNSNFYKHLQQNQQQYQSIDNHHGGHHHTYNHQHYNHQAPPYHVGSKHAYKQRKSMTGVNGAYTQRHQNHESPEYDSIYAKRNAVAASNGSSINTNLSKSTANLHDSLSSTGFHHHHQFHYNHQNNVLASKSGTMIVQDEPGQQLVVKSTPTSTGSTTSTSAITEFLKPASRLCTIIKHTSVNKNSIDSSSIINIGFGVFLKQTSTLIPNYLRVSIVNYKSPAYVAGVEAGDYIIEINGRNTLQMSHDESLHYIKTSYEINGQVRLLVASEFCYNWLREHGTLFKLNSEDASVFNYVDYLKLNRRYVPRLCRLRAFAHSKSFGFSVATFDLSPPNTIVPNASQHATFAHMITGVDVDTPAYLAGLLKNDRVIECDGVNVEHENERQITERMYQSLVSSRQITLFVVDPETDRFFKSKCIKLHSLLPVVQHISNSIHAES